MPPRAFEKRQIALVQLECALVLFEEGVDYISALTLAGAAEEILGKLLERSNIPHALDDVVAATVAIHKHLFDEEIDAKVVRTRANRARNAIKHLDATAALSVTFDPHEEAFDMLNRAIDNYWLLATELTPPMERFQRAQHAG